YTSGRARNKSQYEMQERLYELARLRLEGEIAAAYYNLQVELEKEEVYFYLDSVYSNFSNAAQRRFELGETNYLEKITAQAKQRELNTSLRQAGEDVIVAREELYRIVQDEAQFEIEKTSIPRLELHTFNIEDHVLSDYYAERR